MTIIRRSRIRTMLASAVLLASIPLGMSAGSSTAGAASAYTCPTTPTSVGGVHDASARDYFGAKSTPVVAPTSGVITQIGHIRTGWRLWLKGDDGRFYFMNHLNNDVAPVDFVDTGGVPPYRAAAAKTYSSTIETAIRNRGFNFNGEVNLTLNLRVGRGEVIGYLGDSGDPVTINGARGAENTAAHLHLGIYRSQGTSSPAEDPNVLFAGCTPPTTTSTPPVGGGRAGSDFNGDGLADFGISVKQPNGLTDLRVLTTTKNSAGAPTISANLGYGFSGYYGYDGVKIAAGDFNGDGLADFGLAVKQSTGLADFRVLTTTRATDGSLTLSANLGYGFSGYYGFDGIEIAAGDFNGDGLADFGLSVKQGNGLSDYRVLTTMKNSAGAPTISANLGYGFSGYYGFDGVKIAAGDFNGDGLADFGLSVKQSNGLSDYRVLTTMKNSAGSPTVSANLGYGFSGYYGFDGVKIAAGDFNGDGLADFGLSVKQSNGLSDYRVLTTMKNSAGSPTVSANLGYGFSGYYGYDGVRL